MKTRVTTSEDTRARRGLSHRAFVVPVICGTCCIAVMAAFGGGAAALVAFARSSRIVLAVSIALAGVAIWDLIRGRWRQGLAAPSDADEGSERDKR